MTAEKKAKQEIDELKEHIKAMKEAEKKEKRKLADGDAIKKIKRYEDQIAELKRELAHHKTVSILLNMMLFARLIREGLRKNHFLCLGNVWVLMNQKMKT